MFGNDDANGEVKKAEYELEIINSKGYARIFLIVADLINFCPKPKNNDQH